MGKYEVIKGLAVGGMAELYLARTRGSVKRVVALKRILPNYACEQEFVHMFLDEARLTAKLQHPNIAQVYDIGTSEEGLFFTMEYVNGENARTMLRTAAGQMQRIPLGLALSIVIQIARGLHYAHEQRGADGESLELVHRDISPSNILVSFDGVTKLIDFGVAKARGRFAETRTGVVKGKVSYMSPEQCQGEELDRRSDVFALGILLHELTTNQRLFREANEFLVLRRIIDEDAPRPSTRIENYPLALEGIVMRALARNLDDRYQNAQDLADALTAFVAENGLDASRESLAVYMQSQFSESVQAWRDTLTQLASRPRAMGKDGWRSKSRSGSNAWTMRAPSPNLASADTGTGSGQSGLDGGQTGEYEDLSIDVLDAGATQVSISASWDSASNRAPSDTGHSPLQRPRRWRWSPRVAVGALAALAALVAVAAAQSGATPEAEPAAPAIEAAAPAPNRNHSPDAPDPLEPPAPEQELVVAEVPAPDSAADAPDEAAKDTETPRTDLAHADTKRASKSRKDRKARNKRRRTKRKTARDRQVKRASRKGSRAAWDPDAALPP